MENESEKSRFDILDAFISTIPKMMMFLIPLFSIAIIFDFIFVTGFGNININTQHDLTIWLILQLLFPIGSFVCVFIIHARISAQWEKRYPADNFAEIPNRKIDYFYKLTMVPTALIIGLAFANELTATTSVDVLWVIVALIFGLTFMKLHTTLFPHPSHPQYDTSVHHGAFMAFLFANFLGWGFVSMGNYGGFLVEYYSSGMLIVALIPSTMIALGLWYSPLINDLKKIKNLRTAIGSEEDISTSFSYIQRLLAGGAPTPDFYPTGLNFLTHTNSEYPWENQTNTDSILALIYSHKNKIFLTNVAILALVIAYPPASVWILYLKNVEPSHIRRPMSETMRLKYEQLIERCGEFYDIEYGNSASYSIKSISPKFSDGKSYQNPITHTGLIGGSYFGYPELPLGSQFFKDYEYWQRRVEELEMIRDKGIMYDSDSTMMLLVNQFGWEDRLSRHINKLELDHLPRKTSTHSVKSSNEGNVSLEVRLSEEISELKDRLQQHETILNRLAEDGRWRYVYEEKRAKNALNDIRTCTESLLHSRCEKLGKEFAPHRRNLDAMIGWLKSEKVGDLDRVGGKYAERIRITVNPATHAMHASDDEYVKALEDFVHLVEWHVENPPMKK